MAPRCWARSSASVSTLPMTVVRPPSVSVADSWAVEAFCSRIEDGKDPRTRNCWASFCSRMETTEAGSLYLLVLVLVFFLVLVDRQEAITLAPLLHYAVQDPEKLEPNWLRMTTTNFKEKLMSKMFLYLFKAVFGYRRFLFLKNKSSSSSSSSSLSSSGFIVLAPHSRRCSPLMPNCLILYMFY